VRQLENAVFRAVVLAEGEQIGLAEFPQIAAPVGLAPPAPAGPPAMMETSDRGELRNAPALAGDEMPEAERAAVDPAPAVTGIVTGIGMGMLPLLDPEGEVRPLEEVEREVIKFALAHYRGQMSEVARRLHIGRSTLYRKLDGLGIAVPAADDRGGQSVIAG